MKRKVTNTQSNNKAGFDTYTINFAEIKVPEIDNNKVLKSKDDWIGYGDNNAFPDFLMKSVKKSTRHSAFISLRANLIKGKEVSYSDNIKSFLENLDEEGSTLEDLLEDVSTDMSILETFACMVRYNANRTKIIHVDYIDSSKVRPSKTLDEMGKIKGYYICNDWSNTKISEDDVEYVEKFNPFPRNSSGKIITPTSTKQLHFYHKQANGQPYLPEISYASCLNFIEMEYETGKYGLNSMLNGFFASAIMSVTASMTPEQKLAFKKNVTDTFQGSENASKLMLTIQETEGNIKVTPINTTDNTPMLKALTDMAADAISTAHRGQPVLAGVQSQGSSLGSDGKLIKTSQELYFNNVILHLQKPILSFIKKVLKFNKLEDYTLTIETLNLVSEDIPEWVFQDYMTPEFTISHYGLKKEGLRPELFNDYKAPADTVTPAVIETVEPILENPYPDNL